MYINHFRKFFHDCLESFVQGRAPAQSARRVSIVAGSLSMCVRMVEISGTSLRISLSSRVTSSCACFHAELFIEFQVLLDVELAIQILHADVVDVEVVARGDGANPVEDILATHGHAAPSAP